MSVPGGPHDSPIPLAPPAGGGREGSRRLGVVHLVWGPLGPEPLRRFVRSYRAHPAGVEHELIVLLNNVSPRQRPRLLAELEGVPHRLLVMPEPEQDLAAYAQAVRWLEHERLCFLNSHSEILAPDWLAMLDRALDQPHAGLVGATGSWASTRSWVLHSYFLPTPYRGHIPERGIARAQFLAIELERAGLPVSDASEPPTRTLRESLRAKLQTLPDMPAQILGFEGFPAHHLRTNAFMAARATLDRVWERRIETKMDAYRLENGRHSITRQVQAMGLRTLVVARDGSSYDCEQWPLSRTLWQGDQEGLLIADNQTRSYAHGGHDRRRLLSAFAWGPHADPFLSDGEQRNGRRDHEG
ncbi:MAG: hypothetical protein ACHQE6_08100 [Solirubrobacterales bacterium]